MNYSFEYKTNIDNIWTISHMYEIYISYYLNDTSIIQLNSNCFNDDHTILWKLCNLKWENVHILHVILRVN